MRTFPRFNGVQVGVLRICGTEKSTRNQTVMRFSLIQFPPPILNQPADIFLSSISDRLTRHVLTRVGGHPDKVEVQNDQPQLPHAFGRFNDRL